MLPVGSNVRQNELPRATLILIAINFAIFIVEALMPDGALMGMIEVFAMTPRNLFFLYPFITSQFLHGSVDHIVFNMLFLWIFGGPMEERMGRRRYVMAYLISGVAANILFISVHMIEYGFEGAGGLGASGAISGVMALYLYRCFYAKLKMVIDPVFLPVKIGIPAAPLIVFWFLKDIISGIGTFGSSDGVAHWAHVGGFLCGFVIGRIYRYGHEGRIENMRQKILAKLEEGGGWQAAKDDLMKLYAIAPEDAEVNHDLARLYVQHEDPAKAVKHFGGAIRNYFRIGSSAAGAYTVIEALQAYRKPMSIQYHNMAAHALCEMGQYNDARRVLMAWLKGGSLQKQRSVEDLLALLVRTCIETGRDADAKKAMGLLVKGFPQSAHIVKLRKAFKLGRGKVFPPQKKHVEKVETAMDRAGDTGLGFMALAIESVMDPQFILLWIGVEIATFILALAGVLPEFMARNFFEMLGQLVIFFVAVLLAIEKKHDLFSNMFRHAATKGVADKAEGEFNLKMDFDKARLAERKEDFPQAAELYEKYLLKNPTDTEARYRISRIYHNRLDDIARAIHHYEALMAALSPDAPMFDEAAEAVKALQQGA